MLQTRGMRSTPKSTPVPGTLTGPALNVPAGQVERLADHRAIPAMGRGETHLGRQKSKHQRHQQRDDGRGNRQRGKKAEDGVRHAVAFAALRRFGAGSGQYRCQSSGRSSRTLMPVNADTDMALCAGMPRVFQLQTVGVVSLTAAASLEGDPSKCLST